MPFSSRFVRYAAFAACLFTGGLVFGAEAPPAIFSKNSRILFQGDSITDGNRGRNLDPNHILGHGYVFIIAAHYGADFPERKLTFLNRGVSGDTVRDLLKRKNADILDLHPDVLSLLIGTNDRARATPMDEFEKTYDRLLAEVRASNPKVKFVLGEPFGLPVGKLKSDWSKVSTDLAARRTVVEKLAKKYGATLVRYQAAFDAACDRAPAEYWIWDGIHPTYAGHQIMADAWMHAVMAGTSK